MPGGQAFGTVIIVYQERAEKSWNITVSRGMMKDMKNPARILIGTVCCLSLFSAQAVFCAPDTPLDTVAAIDLQVQEAVSKVREEEEAQRQQMH